MAEKNSNGKASSLTASRVTSPSFTMPSKSKCIVTAGKKQREIEGTQQIGNPTSYSNHSSSRQSTIITTEKMSGGVHKWECALHNDEVAELEEEDKNEEYGDFLFYDNGSLSSDDRYRPLCREEATAATAEGIREGSSLSSSPFFPTVSTTIITVPLSVSMEVMATAAAAAAATTTTKTYPENTNYRENLQQDMNKVTSGNKNSEHNEASPCMSRNISSTSMDHHQQHLDLFSSAVASNALLPPDSSASATLEVGVSALDDSEEHEEVHEMENHTEREGKPLLSDSLSEMVVVSGFAVGFIQAKEEMDQPAKGEQEENREDEVDDYSEEEDMECCDAFSDRAVEPASDDDYYCPWDESPTNDGNVEVAKNIAAFPEVSDESSAGSSSSSSSSSYTHDDWWDNLSVSFIEIHDDSFSTSSSSSKDSGTAKEQKNNISHADHSHPYHPHPVACKNQNFRDASFDLSVNSSYEVTTTVTTEPAETEASFIMWEQVLSEADTDDHQEEEHYYEDEDDEDSHGLVLDERCCFLSQVVRGTWQQQQEQLQHQVSDEWLWQQQQQKEQQQHQEVSDEWHWQQQQQKEQLQHQVSDECEETRFIHSLWLPSDASLAPSDEQSLAEPMIPLLPTSTTTTTVAKNTTAIMRRNVSVGDFRSAAEQRQLHESSQLLVCHRNAMSSVSFQDLMMLQKTEPGGNFADDTTTSRMIMDSGMTSMTRMRRISSNEDLLVKLHLLQSSSSTTTATAPLSLPSQKVQREPQHQAIQTVDKVMTTKAPLRVRMMMVVLLVSCVLASVVILRFHSSCSELLDVRNTSCKSPKLGFHPKNICAFTNTVTPTEDGGCDGNRATIVIAASRDAMNHASAEVYHYVMDKLSTFESQLGSFGFHSYQSARKLLQVSRTAIYDYFSSLPLDRLVSVSRLRNVVADACHALFLTLSEHWANRDTLLESFPQKFGGLYCFMASRSSGFAEAVTVWLGGFCSPTETAAVIKLEDGCQEAVPYAVKALSNLTPIVSATSIFHEALLHAQKESLAQVGIADNTTQRQRASAASHSTLAKTSRPAHQAQPSSYSLRTSFVSSLHLYGGWHGLVTNQTSPTEKKAKETPVAAKTNTQVQGGKGSCEQRYRVQETLPLLDGNGRMNELELSLVDKREANALKDETQPQQQSQQQPVQQLLPLGKYREKQLHDLWFRNMERPMVQSAIGKHSIRADGLWLFFKRRFVTIIASLESGSRRWNHYAQINLLKELRSSSLSLLRFNSTLLNELWLLDIEEALGDKHGGDRQAQGVARFEWLDELWFVDDEDVLQNVRL